MRQAPDAESVRLADQGVHQAVHRQNGLPIRPARQQQHPVRYPPLVQQRGHVHAQDRLEVDDNQDAARHQRFGEARGQGWRGPRLNSFMSIVRSIQDIMGTLVFGGVFQRHPGLKVVCVEADAGWVPHYMYRMDHAWNRHRNWLAPGVTLERKPSEYFADHIYVTFQDDWTAFRFADDMNWHRLMWANDFPHSDSTWPWSQELLAEHASHLRPEQRRAILCDNVAELYGIDTSVLPVGGDVLAASAPA